MAYIIRRWALSTILNTWVPSLPQISSAVLQILFRERECCPPCPFVIITVYRSRTRTFWFLFYTLVQKLLGWPCVTFRLSLTGRHFQKCLQFYRMIAMSRRVLSSCQVCVPACKSNRMSFVVLAITSECCCVVWMNAYYVDVCIVCRGWSGVAGMSVWWYYWQLMCCVVLTLAYLVKELLL